MLKGNLLGTNHCERVKLSLIDNYIFQRIGLEKFFFFFEWFKSGWAHVSQRLNKCLLGERQSFTIFTELNPRGKFTSSQFVKLNPLEKIFTLGSLSINGGHIKNILQDIKQYK